MVGSERKEKMEKENGTQNMTAKPRGDTASKMYIRKTTLVFGWLHAQPMRKSAEPAKAFLWAGLPRWSFSPRSRWTTCLG